jgi:hypothetical protein
MIAAMEAGFGLVKPRLVRWAGLPSHQICRVGDNVRDEIGASGAGRVTHVEVVGDHRIRVAFDDGVVGEVDASTWDRQGVFAPLRDPAFFAKVDLDAELGTISWPNGADVAPETMAERPYASAGFQDLGGFVEYVRGRS